MIEFSLDDRSGLPPYLQIVRQVRQALRLGLLREGDQLPTVKDVVSRLAINPNTVLKAYRELEHERLAAPRPGVGTFVTRSLATESVAAARLPPRHPRRPRHRSRRAERRGQDDPARAGHRHARALRRRDRGLRG